VSILQKFCSLTAEPEYKLESHQMKERLTSTRNLFAHPLFSQQSSIRSSKEERKKKRFYAGQQENSLLRVQLLQVISVYTSPVDLLIRHLPTKTTIRMTFPSDSNTTHMQMQLHQHKHFYTDL